MITIRTQWIIETQKATQRTATRANQEWTLEELELLAAFEGEALEELARTLGRTYYAVATMRSMIAAGRVDPDGRKIADRTRGPKPCPECFVITACDC